MGEVDSQLPADQARELLAALPRLWTESDAYPNYEGRTGASPREVKMLLLNAAQSAQHGCLTPLAVLAEIEELTKNPSLHEFLRQEPMQGGYHEMARLLQLTTARWLDRVDEELRLAMGLVEERQYVDWKAKACCTCLKIFGMLLSHFGKTRLVKYRLRLPRCFGEQALH